MKVPEDGSAQKTRPCRGRAGIGTGHRLELALLEGIQPPPGCNVPPFNK